MLYLSHTGRMLIDATEYQNKVSMLIVKLESQLAKYTNDCRDVNINKQLIDINSVDILVKEILLKMKETSNYYKNLSDRDFQKSMEEDRISAAILRKENEIKANAEKSRIPKSIIDIPNLVNYMDEMKFALPSEFNRIQELFNDYNNTSDVSKCINDISVEQIYSSVRNGIYGRYGSLSNLMKHIDSCGKRGTDEYLNVEDINNMLSACRMCSSTNLSCIYRITDRLDHVVKSTIKTIRDIQRVTENENYLCPHEIVKLYKVIYQYIVALDMFIVETIHVLNIVNEDCHRVQDVYTMILLQLM